jgi:hypothetical protein
MTEPKLAKDMTAAERHAALNAIRRAARTFEPMATDRKAKDMNPAERKAFLDRVKFTLE